MGRQTRQKRNAKNTTQEEPKPQLDNSTPAECPICLDRYQAEGLKAPLVLNCGHSVCQECSPGLLDSTTGHWSCPMRCSELTRSQPRPNFALREQLDALQVISPSQADAPLCDNCEETDASQYCAQCCASLCALCAESLHSPKVMKKHVLCELGKETRLQICDEHQEPLKYYCLDCKTVVCTDCKEFGEHKGHEHDLVMNVAATHRGQLKEMLENMQQLDDAATQTARDVEQVVLQLVPATTMGCCDQENLAASNDTAAVAEDQIRQHFQHARELLTAREEALVTEVLAVKVNKLTKLDQQQAALGAHRSLIHTTQFRLQAAIQGGDIDLAAQFGQCQAAVEQLSQSAEADPHFHGPVVTAVINVVLPERIEFDDYGHVDDGMGVQLQFGSAFDTNGVLYHIATAGGTEPYKNPHTSGQVKVSNSGQSTPELFVQHESSGQANYTANQAGTNMSVDLGEGRSVVPNHYCLRHGHSHGNYVLYNWELQGSNDGTCWNTLKQHKNDIGLPRNAFSVAAWPVEADEAFRHFRVLSTGTNSDANSYLMCAGIELYGTLRELDVEKKKTSSSSDDGGAMFEEDY